MSLIKCQKCKKDFDGEKHPVCPSCLGETWSNNPNFLKPKHDPSNLESPIDCYRSVLSPDVVEDSQRVYAAVAQGGTCYLNVRNKEYCIFLDKPLESIPGSAVYGGDTSPTKPLSGLLVVKVDRTDAHIYSEEYSKFKVEIETGVYLPLPVCSEPGCMNKATLRKTKCLVHLNSG